MSELARSLVGPELRRRARDRINLYALGVALMPAAALIGLGNGVALQLREMTSMRFEGWHLQPGVYKIMNVGGPARYVLDHLREDDVIIATHPDVVDHYLAYYREGTIRVERRTNYWLQSTLEYPAVFDEHHPRTLHRFSGTPMLLNREDLEDCFAKHAAGSGSSCSLPATRRSTSPRCPNSSARTWKWSTRITSRRSSSGARTTAPPSRAR